MIKSDGSSCPSIDSFPFNGTKRMLFFDRNVDCNKLRTCGMGKSWSPPENDISYAIGHGATVGQNKCYQNWGNSLAPYSESDVSVPPSGGFMIRAGSSGINNQIWCIPPFPVTTDTTYLFNSAIGQAANITSTTLTNNTWTDGTDQSYPMYPTEAAWHGGDSSESGNRWYYQVVYDKDKLAGAGVTTRDDSVSPPVSPCDPSTNSNCHTVFTLPTLLWNTATLQQHFPDSTIMSMRKYFCGKQLTTDVTGKSIDPKCWGYLSIMYNGWKFIPMSIPK